ncbi:hypothetical protein PHLCEN_2v5697 [Hermanssonia centrifuga]|uniref:MYND-type domain-containing protein n=1 Tax=Hermanssonia centrifuga TaxID=98765 RepID=A0A2R6P1M9_9APHY|nr:hypothetical protein PHLCEN_2v5697 [Hermanssonia centrifuga]
MAHPVFWPSKTFFYPIGNTAPICLSQNLALGENANVLLLGCGDPRNILYTLHASGADLPATRNVLLLSLIADEDDSNHSVQLWNIFYHFLLDDNSHALLISQCHKLVKISTSIEAWNASEYSSFLRMRSQFTLAELNRLWAAYAQTAEFSSTRGETFKKKFLGGMRKIAREQDQSVTSGFRSAGPLCMESFSIVSEAHRQYWNTGITSSDPPVSEKASKVNPTFAYATQGEGFVAHYGTAPLPAFHLAPAFASSTPRTPTIAQVYDIARKQFQAWCDTFRSCVRSTGGTTVVLRLVVGDVLAVCHTLHNALSNTSTTAHHCISAWHATSIALDGDDCRSTGVSPSQFNVIDTSNLCDHIGMLNILVAATPLLARTPSATLYTETLLASGQDPTASFNNSLCGDVMTMSALLDIIPLSLASGFSTCSNVHEIIAHHASSDILRANQYHERISWKIPSLLNGDPCKVDIAVDDPDCLARLLFNVYLKMFSHENMGALFQQINISALHDRSRIHYCRRSFSLFVVNLKNRITADWPRTINALLSSIAHDRQLLVGMNFYQELLCHFHMLGIYSEQIFLPNNSLLIANKAQGPFSDWSNVPPVVCVVMEIPADSMHLLDDTSEGGNPFLLAGIRGPNFYNTFASFQAGSGKVVCQGIGGNSRIYLTRESSRQDSTSPVVISFCVPTWMLSIDPRNTSVSIAVQSTPATTMQWAPKLGMEMLVYSARLMDAKSVHVVPPTAVEQSFLSTPPTYVVKDATSTPSDITSIIIDEAGKSIAYVKIRANIVGKAKDDLARVGTEVSVEQARQMGLDLKIGSSFIQKLEAPFPVDASRSKLRVARKSSWVEVLAPPPHAIGTLPGNPFPVVHSTSRTQMMPWNIHSTNLDRLPTLDISKAESIQWMNPHVSLMMSDREVTLRGQGIQGSNALVQVKDSIHALIIGYCDKKASVFGLNRESSGGMDTLIFVTGIRMDPGPHTVVADAFVLPLTEILVQKLGPSLGAIVSTITQSPVSDQETIAWKYLLPALVERCRDWKHKSNCAYIQSGMIPISTQHGENPICDCGKGKVSPSFTRNKQWAAFVPYVTRIAVSPLFAVSYLETIGEHYKDAVREANTGVAQQRPASHAAGSYQCAGCKTSVAEGKALRCSACKNATYCGRECQKSDWKKHKIVCKKLG